MAQLMLCSLLASALLLISSTSHAFLIQPSPRVLKINPRAGRRPRPRHREASFLVQVSIRSQASSSSSSSSSSSFDWSSEWYPVAPVRDLSQSTPNKITLLGKDFCVWYDATNENWNAFADSCPHRLVPLSEGRLERGLLQCAYHGWEFNSQGSCVEIPQASQAFQPPAAACATKFPVQVAQDLLWLFPSSIAEALAKLKSLALIPQLDDPEKVDATDMFCRDLPYSWQVLVENLCDPSHVVYAHHSVMRGANRYGEDETKRVDLKVVGLDKEGFTAERDPQPENNGRYQVRFQPPCLLYYDISNSRALGQNLSDEKRAMTYVGLGSYCIPTGPNTSRLIARFPFYLPVPAAMFALKYTPRWITHFSQNFVMDSDMVFLAMQDEQLQQLEQRDNNPPKYYLPTRSDAMVLAFRKWLQAFGSPIHWLGTSIPTAAATATSRSSSGSGSSWTRVPQRSGRDALLDRYRQHTEICSSCRKAHQRLYQLRSVLTVVSFGLLAIATATAGSASSSSTLWRCSFKKLQVATAVASVLMFLTPRLLLQPLIVRLECVPWPRKEWLNEPKKQKKKVVQM